MSIPKFTRLTTTACPLNIENIDTDQIIPARFLKAVERKGFGDNLFRDWRFDKAGARVDGFPRDFGRREELRLRLVARARGLGHFRLRLPRGRVELFRRHIQEQCAEQRPAAGSGQRAFLGKDLRCDRGRSAGSFRGRSAESDVHDSLDIDGYKKECLLNGYDDVDYLLSIRDDIARYEQAHA